MFSCSVFLRTCSARVEHSYFGPFEARKLCKVTAISVCMYNSPIDRDDQYHVTHAYKIHELLCGTRKRTLQMAACHAQQCALSHNTPVRHGDRYHNCRRPPRATHSRVRPTADHDAMLLLGASRANAGSQQKHPVRQRRQTGGHLLKQDGCCPSAAGHHVLRTAARAHARGTPRQLARTH